MWRDIVVVIEITPTLNQQTAKGRLKVYGTFNININSKAYFKDVYVSRDGGKC